MNFMTPRSDDPTISIRQSDPTISIRRSDSRLALLSSLVSSLLSRLVSPLSSRLSARQQRLAIGDRPLLRSKMSHFHEQMSMSAVGKLGHFLKNVSFFRHFHSNFVTTTATFKNCLTFCMTTATFKGP
jgi:hypothetical protein